ncbi:hypothetical protein FAVG1_04558 [Fusarium avenaceum]|nr:hypothetical protein FAVG1_04558 [Fusarium avenaceum]
MASTLLISAPIHCLWKTNYYTPLTISSPHISKMCYIRVIHFTRCDTRRPAIINIASGNTIFHPLEPPAPCEHRDQYLDAECPYHGACCTPGQIHVCNVKGPKDVCRGWQTYHEIINPGYMYSSGLFSVMQFIPDWEELEMNSDLYTYEEDIRGAFFDLGAHMYEVAKRAAFIVDYLLSTETYSAAEEADMVVEHGDLFNEWIICREELAEQTEAWEILASVGCMEVCPAQLLSAHPWSEVFQECLNKQVGFPQFPGIPFTWLENIERRDEILCRHPQFSQYHVPRPQPSRADHLWRSPAPPQRLHPEGQRQVEDSNEPYPGEWAAILSRVAEQENAPSGQDEVTVSSSGKDAPEWVIPYGQEPEMNWKEISWDGPTTLIISPLVSPRVHAQAPVEAAMDIDVSPLDITFADMPGNPFDDEFEVDWHADGNESEMKEELAVLQYLRVEAPVEEHNFEFVPFETVSKLKRRWSELDVTNGGEEEVRAKRSRTI